MDNTESIGNLKKYYNIENAIFIYTTPSQAQMPQEQQPTQSQFQSTYQQPIKSGGLYPSLNPNGGFVNPVSDFNDKIYTFNSSQNVHSTSSNQLEITDHSRKFSNPTYFQLRLSEFELIKSGEPPSIEFVSLSPNQNGIV